MRSSVLPFLVAMLAIAAPLTLVDCGRRAGHCLRRAGRAQRRERCKRQRLGRKAARRAD